MKEHPILFSGEMVNAILDGRKTVTRRVIKRGVVGRMMGGNQKLWPYVYDKKGKSVPAPCPYGQPGDLLWVRETFCVWDATTDDYEGDLHRGKLPVPNEHNIHFWKKRVQYRASTECDDESYQWRPSIHMPRWASRINLEVTGVRVERVQDITVIGAIDEGIKIDENSYSYVGQFRTLWDKINAKRGHSWDSNPWVWVVEFKKL